MLRGGGRQRLASMGQRVLFVLTSNDDLGGVRTTGFFVGEAAQPLRVLHAAGVQVDLAPLAGGPPPMDGRDEGDRAQNDFLADPSIREQLRNTPRLADIDPTDYDAVLFVGGHGTMWDFPDDPDVARVGRDIFEACGIVGAVCHGSAALVNMTLSDGTPLVAGKTVAAFSNEEEAAVRLTGTVPFLLEDVLLERGARHTTGPTFTEHVAVSDRLVTGQNPKSATKVGEEILALLRHT
jgi:putative intracellular protease/amidase